MQRFLLTAFALIIFSTHLFSQLTVASEDNDTAFIYSLAGVGIVVSNIERNCADTASGYFNSITAMLELTVG